MKSTTNATTLPPDIIAALEVLDPADLERIVGMTFRMIEVAEIRRKRPARKRSTVAAINPWMTFR
jgi:hypothetical protein